MKKVFVALCMAGLLAATTSCKTSNSAASSVSALNGEWKITEVNGQSITKADNYNEAFIGFDVDILRHSRQHTDDVPRHEDRGAGAQGCQRS